MKKTAFLILLLFTPLLLADVPKDLQKRWFNYKDSRLDRAIGGLSEIEQDLFVVGRSFFTIPWVFSPSATTARDGLGPLFNANTCVSCHRGNGLGETFNAKGKISRAMVTKLSRKSGKPVPFYGKQIAVNGTVDIPFEAMPTRKNTPITVTYPDGRVVVLQKPTYGLTHLNYGPLPDDIIIVQRRAPALFGLGLISQIDDQTILENADPEDKDRDGISGKPNWVLSHDGKKKLGRFTAKAAVASVLEQSADAAINDMGLTNPIFPEENCTVEQTACLNLPRARPAYDGNTLDLTAARLQAITTFLKSTRIPVKNPKKIEKIEKIEKQGKQLFTTVGCSSCHLPQISTRDGMKIAPYSDFLLHDMGEGLADGRSEFAATGREFRTAPLWGLSSYAKTLKSKKPFYLHDGRAETIEQAILWHGGEAEGTKKRFMALTAEERQAILFFLNQL